jgi:hypothetical protein
MEEKNLLGNDDLVLILQFPTCCGCFSVDSVFIDFIWEKWLVLQFISFYSSDHSVLELVYFGLSIFSFSPN